MVLSFCVYRAASGEEVYKKKTYLYRVDPDPIRPYSVNFSSSRISFKISALKNFIFSDFGLVVVVM